MRGFRGSRRIEMEVKQILYGTKPKDQEGLLSTFLLSFDLSRLRRY